MRTSLQRAMTLAATVPVLAGTLSGTASATHDSAPVCGLGSTVLVDFTVLGGSPTRVSTYEVSPTVTNVCINVLGLGEVVAVVKSGVALTPPSVTQTPGVGACATRIIDMTAPVALSLSVGASTGGPAICLGQNGTTTTISFNAASVQTLPDVDVWTQSRSALNTLLFCMPDYARASAGLTDWYAFDYCVDADHRLI